MKTYILIPEGRGMSKIIEKFDVVIEALATTRFFALKALVDGTPLNGYFIDEALTDRHGIPLGDLKKETDWLCQLKLEKKGTMLFKWLEKREQTRKFWAKENRCRKNR